MLIYMRVDKSQWKKREKAKRDKGLRNIEGERAGGKNLIKRRHCIDKEKGY